MYVLLMADWYKSTAANDWQRRVTEVKEKLTAHIRFDMMQIASKGDEDEASGLN